jgi:hypothetical protein
MDSLISDLLDFGKIQSGTFSLALQQKSWNRSCWAPSTVSGFSLRSNGKPEV